MTDAKCPDVPNLNFIPNIILLKMLQNQTNYISSERAEFPLSESVLRFPKYALRAEIQTDLDWLLERATLPFKGNKMITTIYVTNMTNVKKIISDSLQPISQRFPQ